MGLDGIGRNYYRGRILLQRRIIPLWFLIFAPRSSSCFTLFRPPKNNPCCLPSVLAVVVRHTPLFLANNNNKPNNKSSSSNANTDQNEEEIPANLRRKITAKRPPLGHIVPRAVRRRRRAKSGGSSNPRLRPQGKAREAGLNNPSMLKISAGSAKGRRLDSPSVYLRPMMGKVREAVFSTLTSFGLYDNNDSSSSNTRTRTRTRHLDIFAGSGSVGLESLSRGAVHCTFVDLSDDCCAAIQRNIDWCQFGHDADNDDEEEGKKGRVVCADALMALREPAAAGIPEGSTFQIVTLCPPYEEVVYGDLLEAVANSDLVTDDTVVMIEYPIELGCLPHVVSRSDGGAMVGVRNRRYGRTVIAMYVVNPTGELEVADSRPEEFVSV